MLLKPRVSQRGSAVSVVSDASKSPQDSGWVKMANPDQVKTIYKQARYSCCCDESAQHILQ